MSDVVGEAAAVRAAFDKPTLRLLDRKYAPVVLAVFATVFTGDVRSIPAGRLHTHVDVLVEELLAAGEELPTGLSGRQLCVRWMNEQWLYRTLNDAGDEEYTITSHAIQATDIVRNLSERRALISESRLTTILEAVRRWATQANPDREARLERLAQQIAELQTEHARIEAGGDLDRASDDQMIQAYADLSDLIHALPGDFRRVEESVQRMHRDIVEDFRAEDRPIATVISDYLNRATELTTATPEGRAFDGAIELLRDEALRMELRRDIDTILSHSFSEALTPSEVREFRGTANVLRRGLNDVLTQRSRLSRTLRDHIVNHDAARDREIDQLLRHIGRQLGDWMHTAGPRSAVPVPLLPATVDIAHLRQRFHDPGNDAAPPPLEDVTAAAPSGLTLHELQAQGGPTLDALRARLHAAIDAGDADTLADVFDALPEHLRRPVEILGLFHLFPGAGIAADRETFGIEDRDGVYAAVRADGTVRVFHGDAGPLHEPQEPQEPQ